ncbi:hypothetical protein Pan110_39900 [Gimesia panareensis]|nr:hypothetical protein Pan110_39900 [Gimesia panareensis]
MQFGMNVASRKLTELLSIKNNLVCQIHLKAEKRFVSLPR